MNLRSFLDWLRSDKKAPEPAPSGWREKRKENRVDLPSQHHLKVVVTDGSRSAVGRMKNASVRGGRVEFDQDVFLSKTDADKPLQAVLTVDGQDIRFNCQMVRLISGRLLAIRFVAPFPKELERLESFLEPRCLGRSLREIDAQALQTGTNKRLRWFQGVNDTGLYTWTTLEGTIVQQQLVFLDRFVEWGAESGVRTGRVQGDVGKTGPSWSQSELLDFDAAPDKGLLSQAKTLLESSAIDDGVRRAFLEKLS